MTHYAPSGTVSDPNSRYRCQAKGIKWLLIGFYVNERILHNVPKPIELKYKSIYSSKIYNSSLIFSISRHQVQPVWSLVACYLKSVSQGAVCSDDKEHRVIEVIEPMVSKKWQWRVYCGNCGFRLEFLKSCF